MGARQVYGSDVLEIWFGDIVPRILSGTLTKLDQDELHECAPNFLAELEESHRAALEQEALTRNREKTSTSPDKD